VRQKISLTVAAALTTGIFISDVLTPMGVADWLLYLIPLFIASRVLKPSYVLLFASVCTILIVVGLFFPSSHEGDVTQAIINRNIGVFTLWVITFLMIKSKQAEERIIELNKRLNDHVKKSEALNKELEAFSYSVSHDLRAPLGLIHGLIYLLSEKYSPTLDEEGREYIRLMQTSSERMKESINALLDMSRLGRSEMQKKKVNLNSLVSEIIRETQEQMKERKIIWEIDELPDVDGDRSLLRLAMVNLVSNAVKFTSTRPQSEIKIGCKDEGDKFTFSVTDNGVGFDMQYVDKLFGVFQRLHTEDEFEGTGIGLANVKRIIARHGGSVWAEGAVGQGATFYFTFPKIKKV
jgi:light-regulated signal transduction histidine kinase (bacteriophytochrome)